ncbi:metallophosphoesterase [Candidatus Latescibacterota bacterium]
MRIFATSDLHADFHANRELVEGISPTEYRQDGLVLAGDVAHRLEELARVLETLRERFAWMVFVPGNHDLWVRGEEGDSLEKFHRILELCDSLGVTTAPSWMGGHRVVPLFSWYDPSLDGGQSTDPIPERWADQRHCRWPEGMGLPATYFAKLNEPHLAAAGTRSGDAKECENGGGPHHGTAVGGCARELGATVPQLTITISHFVPRRDLLPPTELLRFRELPKVAGNPLIEGQLRAAGSHLHVFGHSHIRRDCVIDGVRYVQHSLGYPRERRESELGPKQIV